MFEIKQVDRSNSNESSMDSFDRYQEVKKVWFFTESYVIGNAGCEGFQRAIAKPFGQPAV